MSQLNTEVLIIGGGILGTAVARELSKYKVDVTLVEKEVDIGWGSTKSNSCLVCQGADALSFRKEYRNSKFVWESMPLMEPLCQELDVPFRRVGELSVIRNNDELSKFVKLKRKQEEWVPDMTPQRFIDREELSRMEPNVSKKFIGALYDPDMAVTDPVRLAIALAENARDNGVNVMTGIKVLDISQSNDGFEVQTTQGNISARFIINTAGVFADKIAALLNADNFVLYPVKGYVGILDKKVGKLVSHNILARPQAPGEMNIVTPSIHDNLFFGIQLRLARRGDCSNDKEMARKALVNAQELVPDISAKDIITAFSGFIMYRNFEMGWHECVVRASDKVPRFITLVIGFPGISASPAAAKEAVKLLAQEGLELEERSDFDPYRKAIVEFSELPEEDKKILIAKDSRYGHVVCRCETVTEGEIVEAIKRGATTLDGVKYRCRPGMGRCQGGFCGPRVTDILARELGISREEVTKKGEDSRHLLYRNKELLGKN
ncbi:MAG: FAD-dependent oxidoreductase [Dehalococcoidia bacterium]|nr:FAD-dependent oxidoreductase [Dehalococcoidia bacterium]